MRNRHGDKAEFRRYQLYKLFNKKWVLGIYLPKGGGEGEEIIAYPAIVSEDMFYQAKAMIKDRLKTRVGKPFKKDINFFKTKLSCGYCGYAITMVRSRDTSRYRCRNKAETKIDCGQKSALTVHLLQPSLLYATSLIDKDDMLESASNSRKSKLSKQINTLQSALEDKQTRMDNLADLVAAGSKKGVQMVVQRACK